MAGTGITISPLAEGRSLVTSVTSATTMVAVSAGPWLFTVAALGTIGVVCVGHVPLVTLDGFRLATIYAFAISLIMSAPVILATAPILTRLLHQGDADQIRSLFAAMAIVTSALCASASLLVHGAIFQTSGPVTVAATSCAAVIAVVWTAVSICSRVRDDRGPIVSFGIGLFVSVVMVVAASRWATDIAIMVLAFTSGLVVTATLLVARILTGFPDGDDDVRQAATTLATALDRHGALVAAGFVGAVALWIDKWIFASSAEGVVHPSGMIHAPSYDSAMFTAYLSIIPAVALFVRWVDHVFHVLCRSYFAGIENHASLRQIERRGEHLKTSIVSELTRITIIQTAICVVVVGVAPKIIAATGLFYSQVGILRLGAIGALFHFIFFAASALLLNFNRHRTFFGLQVMFLILQATFAVVSLVVGPETYGLGYLLASVISAVVAKAVLERTLDDLTYLTFMRPAAHAEHGRSLLNRLRDAASPSRWRSIL